MRTPNEIREEIEKLRGLEFRVRPYSMFGGDNRAKIRAEIKVLEEDLSEDDIYDLEGIVDEDTLSIMMGARDWLDGEDLDGAPSKGWEILVEK